MSFRGEGHTRITPIYQNIFYFRQALLISLKSLDRTLPVRNIRRGHCDGMRQTLGVNHNMALDSRDFFASVVTFVPRGIGIFNALRINDAETRFLCATMVDAGPANLIFLKPAQAGLILLLMAWRSIGRNNGKPCSISESLSAAFAIDSRFLKHRELHKTPHTSQLAVAWSSFGRSRATVE